VLFPEMNNIGDRRNCANPLDIMATPGVKKKSEREGPPFNISLTIGIIFPKIPDLKKPISLEEVPR
jgi:hypothetical protein